MYHYGGQQAFTKYELALMIADILCVEVPEGFLIANAEEPSPEQAAARPKDTRLDCGSLVNKLRAAGVELEPCVEVREGLEAVLKSLIPAAGVHPRLVPCRGIASCLCSCAFSFGRSVVDC